MLIAVNKVPIATLNAIVINNLVTKECEAFSNVSVFGVHTENGSFSKCTVFKFIRFHSAEQCERKAKTEKFYSVFI